MTLEERQERNARQRARWQSLPPEERRALLAQRNASYASRRDTPCMDSIVSNCPTGSLLGHASSSSYAFSYPSTLTQTFSTIQGNSHIHIPLFANFVKVEHAFLHSH